MKTKLEHNKTAVLLLSGGLDSYTTALIASKGGYDLYALSFKYGQRHQFETDCAKNIAAKLNIKSHVTMEIDLRVIGGSSLTSDIEVPKARGLDKMSAEIPITYVPARNTIFLSYALAWAEVLECSDIFIGVNSVDYSGYPDCRPEFIQAYQNMANLATKAAVEGRQHIKIHTPLMDLNKAQIITLGMELGADYSITSTCYSPNENGDACGECDACLLRLRGFEEAGYKDPIKYSHM